ncbi:MAG TPA: hypothetical protein VK767_05100 [Bradyrhizobium sp.]|jgi:hypothetical protein|nr:hypothetical protein [Bradyrhizobium sp.]
MARVAVPTAKASVFDTPAGLVINIPSTKNFGLILFLGFWLCGWFFGEFSTIRQLATGKTATGISLFMVVWLGGWTVGGAAAIYFWLWNIAGHEIISLTPSSLTIRRNILGFGRSREYDLPSVKNLRIIFTLANTNLTIPAQSFGGGTIAFDYGAKTFRFGGGLDEAEASHLIELLKSRYPFDAAASQ